MNRIDRLICHVLPHAFLLALTADGRLVELRIARRDRPSPVESIFLGRLERVMPERISPAPVDREAVRSDLQMLLGCDGCERTLAQFEALLRGAGLRTHAVTPLTRDFSLIEAAVA